MGQAFGIQVLPEEPFLFFPLQRPCIAPDASTFRGRKSLSFTYAVFPQVLNDAREDSLPPHSDSQVLDRVTETRLELSRRPSDEKDEEIWWIRDEDEAPERNLQRGVIETRLVSRRHWDDSCGSGRGSTPACPKEWQLRSEECLFSGSDGNGA